MVFLLVLSYFPLLPHDTELAYRSVRAHTLLNVNNQDFSKTHVGRQTWAVGEDYNLAVDVVVVLEMHGRGM